MPVLSAGVLIHRTRDNAVEVLLVHPGRPFWRNRDDSAWSIPKGEIEPGADAEATARREVAEEIGVIIDGPLTPLGEVRQRGGKRVIGFAFAGEVDAEAIRSNTFEMVWPPNSGVTRSFPEIDRARWFDLPSARTKMLDGQRPFLDRLQALLGRQAPGLPPLA